jgi:hypothetical protein
MSKEQVLACVGVPAQRLTQGDGSGQKVIGTSTASFCKIAVNWIMPLEKRAFARPMTTWSSILYPINCRRRCVGPKAPREARLHPILAKRLNVRQPPRAEKEIREARTRSNNRRAGVQTGQSMGRPLACILSYYDWLRLARVKRATAAKSEPYRGDEEGNLARGQFARTGSLGDRFLIRTENTVEAAADTFFFCLIRLDQSYRSPLSYF